MLKIALSGCNGRMGRAVTDICAKKEDVKIVAGFDLNAVKLADYPVYANPFEFSGACDVVVDFSNVSLTEELLRYCTQTQTAVVICTTGHDEAQLDAIAKAATVIPVFRSGNMSLGINLMMEVLRKCAAVLGEGYQVELIEKHHDQKLDAPSGTALMLADAVREALPYDDVAYVYDRSQRREKRPAHEIGIHTVRGGTIVGEHSVMFCGRDEIIEIKHEAHSREVFATGAVKAAEYLATKTEAGLYNMSDVIAAQ